MNPTTSTSEATPCAGCTGVKLGTATTKVRYGRVKMSNVYGSELLALRVPTTMQYFKTGAGWATNTDDTCSAITTGNIGLAFAAAKSTRNQLIQSDNKAYACTSGTYISGGKVDINAVRISGTNTCTSAGPGQGSFGYTDVTLTVPSYLQFDWKGTGITNPSVRATFGTYKNKIIFMRENY